MEILVGVLIGIIVAGAAGVAVAHGMMPWQVPSLSSAETVERYRIMFDKSPIGVFICDAPGRFLEVNPTFCDMVGYAAEELKHLDWQTLTHPEDLVVDLPTAERIKKHEVDTLLDYRKRFFHKNGSTVHVSLYVRGLHDTNQTLLYYVCHVIDKNHEHSIEAALAHKNEELQKLHRRLDRADAAVERLKQYTRDLMEDTVVATPNIDSSPAVEKPNA